MATLGDDIAAHPVLQAQKRELMASMFGARTEPRRMGRYVLGEVLGTGGMGVVHAAHDEQLRRNVALKVLRGRTDPTLRQRLIREARTMARVTHPGVVRIYDVGEHDGQTFIAMELVEGITVRTWLEHEQRPWRSVLSVFTAAARGLAAVHAAGLVHRDFKPDNAMLTDDGRVLVMDFGVARTETLGAPGEGPEASASSLELTVTGAWVGTPAYMSPEQLRGDAIDARSDQYNFCVALWEGLYGQRPFSGDTLSDLARAIERGAVDPPPSHSEVPRWLHQAVARGLACDPDRRWPSMGALLDRLASDPAHERRKRWAALGVIAVLGSSLWGVLATAPPEDQACADMQAPLVGVWDRSRRAEVQAAITGTELGYAPRTWELVERRLDDYAEHWTTARTEACRATRRGEQSGERLDLRMACYDERLVHLRATVDTLASADSTVVEKAIELVTALPVLDPCADADALATRSLPPEDPAVADRITALERRLAQAQAQQRAGKYDEALAQVEAIATEAEALGHPRLLARTWLRLGSIQWRLADYEAAEHALSRAFDLAVGEPQRLTPEAATAAADLVALLGHSLERHEQAGVWARYSDPLARALGTTEALDVHANAVGLLALSEGNYDQARERFEQSLALREHTREANPLAVAKALANLGNAEALAGRHDQAHTRMKTAYELLEHALGSDHPEVGQSLTNLGNVMDSLGQLDEARAYHERALAIYERAFGPSNTRVALAQHNLAVVLKNQGRYEHARALNERALEIRERTLGPTHPRVADSLTSLGVLAQTQGTLDEARDHLERASAIYQATLGPEHYSVGVALTNLGSVALAEGDHEQASQCFERAMHVLETSLGPEHPVVASVLQLWSEALIGLGARARALAALERALAIRVASKVAASELAQTRFALARALHAEDPTRALELARLAREGYLDAGSTNTTTMARTLAELDDWLREHAPPGSVYPGTRGPAER